MAKEKLLLQLESGTCTGPGADAVEELHRSLAEISLQALMPCLKELMQGRLPSNPTAKDSQDMDQLLVLLKATVLATAHEFDERFGFQGAAYVECLLLQPTVESFKQAWCVSGE